MTKSAKPKSSEKPATEVLYDYLKAQYRPYGIADLVSNLHNTINKAAMIKALDTFTERGDIVTKAFGKSNYYVFKERLLSEELRESDPLVEDCDHRRKTLEQLNDNVLEAESELRQLEKEYRLLVSNPLSSVLSKKIEILQNEISEIEEQLGETISEDPLTVPDSEWLIFPEYYKSLENIHKKRNSQLNNFIAFIKDNGGDPTRLANDAGIDLGEMQLHQSI